MKIFQNTNSVPVPRPSQSKALDSFTGKMKNSKIINFSALSTTLLLLGQTLNILACLYLLFEGMGTKYRLYYTPYFGLLENCILLSPWIEIVVILINAIGIYITYTQTIIRAASYVGLVTGIFVGGYYRIITTLTKFEEACTAQLPLKPWLTLTRQWSPEEKMAKLDMYISQHKYLETLDNKERLDEIRAMAPNTSIDLLYSTIINYTEEVLLLKQQNVAQATTEGTTIVISELRLWMYSIFAKEVADLILAIGPFVTIVSIVYVGLTGLLALRENMNTHASVSAVKVKISLFDYKSTSGEEDKTKLKNVTDEVRTQGADASKNYTLREILDLPKPQRFSVDLTGPEPVIKAPVPVPAVDEKPTVNKQEEIVKEMNFIDAEISRVQQERTVRGAVIDKVADDATKDLFSLVLRCCLEEIESLQDAMAPGRKNNEI